MVRAGRAMPRHLCPCCDFVTLPERRNYLIGPVCFWEDDGQDLDRQRLLAVGPILEAICYGFRAERSMPAIRAALQLLPGFRSHRSPTLLMNAHRKTENHSHLRRISSAAEFAEGGSVLFTQSAE
jgi:hypothetical protein